MYILLCVSKVMFIPLLAMLRMSGAISKSTEVMASMQQLIKLPEIRQNMMELSKEMSKVSGWVGVVMILL